MTVRRRLQGSESNAVLDDSRLRLAPELTRYREAPARRRGRKTPCEKHVVAVRVGRGGDGCHLSLRDQHICGTIPRADVTTMVAPCQLDCAGQTHARLRRAPNDVRPLADGVLEREEGRWPISRASCISAPAACSRL